MKTAKLVYCLDGFHTVEIPIHSIDELPFRLQEIKSEASNAINGIFSADVVLEGFGRISIGIDQRCILAYTSEDFNETYTSLGDETAQGETMYYFGDYTLMSNQYIIPYESAIEELKGWLRTGELGTAVKWTSQLF